MIVLNYNDSELTIGYIRSIENYNILDHIIVVDNASPDGSYERLKMLNSEKVRVIRTEENRGYGSGNNFGLRFLFENYGTDGYVVISNPDIVVLEDCIVQIRKSFDKEPRQFAATGEVHNLYGQRIPLFTWRLPSAGVLFIESSILLRRLGWKLFGYGRRYATDSLLEENGRIEGDVLPGCFFMADAEKFRQIGLFDECTFLYYEEEILFSKARKAGYVSCVVPSVSLVHAEGVSTRKNIRSWAKREAIMEESSICYQRVCLGRSEFSLRMYQIWNRLMMPERYFFTNVKRMMNRKS